MSIPRSRIPIISKQKIQVSTIHQVKMLKLILYAGQEQNGYGYDQIMEQQVGTENSLVNKECH